MMTEYNQLWKSTKEYEYQTLNISFQKSFHGSTPSAKSWGCLPPVPCHNLHTCSDFSAPPSKRFSVSSSFREATKTSHVVKTHIVRIDRIDKLRCLRKQKKLESQYKKAGYVLVHLDIHFVHFVLVPSEFLPRPCPDSSCSLEAQVLATDLSWKSRNWDRSSVNCGKDWKNIKNNWSFHNQNIFKRNRILHVDPCLVVVRVTINKELDCLWSTKNLVSRDIYPSLPRQQ